MKTRITIRPSRFYAGHYRTAVCRFHNSLYLGCVIGVLLGFGLADAALEVPRRAWRQARPRSGSLASGAHVVHAT
jgi:hypothetical protein